jgi:hypothetical protein
MTVFTDDGRTNKSKNILWLEVRKRFVNQIEKRDCQQFDAITR